MKARHKSKSVSESKNAFKKKKTRKSFFLSNISESIVGLKSNKTFIFFQNPRISLWAALVIFMLPVSFIKIYDCDVWWHMQLGRSMLENLGLPDYNRFYFTPINFKYSDLRYTFIGDIFLYGVHWLGNDFGLQFLVLFIVIFSCYLLISIAGPKFNAWHLLALMFFVVGTFQIQLIRNALFSLLFTTLIFWLWWQVRYRGKEKRIWFLPVLIGLWGCIHGSYLLGFGIMVLVFAGDAMDSLRGLNQARKNLIFHFGIVILLSFICISLYNPLTEHYFKIHKIKNIFSYQNNLKNEYVPEIFVKNNSSQAPTEKNKKLNQHTDPLLSGIDIKRVLQNVKNFLNNLFFQQNDAILPSGDFASPFEFFVLLYVKISFLVGLMGLIFLTLFSRPIRFSHLLPFLAVLVAGSGYTRMVGYIPVVATSAIFISARNEEFKLHISHKWAKWAAALAITAIYVNMATSYKVNMGTNLHAFGMGRIPVFSKENAHKILTDFPEKKVFTTIMNGGYLLYNWYPKKKVFIDGFFAPHPYSLFLDYSKFVKGEIDPNVFHEKYGVEIAVIEQFRISLNKSFLKSPSWYVGFIDKGSVVYFYKSNEKEIISCPAILNDENEILNLPKNFRKWFSENLLLIQRDMIKDGRLKDLDLFRKKYSGLIYKLETLMVPQEAKLLHKSMIKYTEIYGTVNSKTIPYEIHHLNAFKNKDFKEAIIYGLKVLEDIPDRLPVLMNLSGIFAINGDIKKSIQFMNRAWEAREKYPEFWNDNGSFIARHCLKLSSYEKNNGRFLAAYDLLRVAHNSDSSVISKKQLYENALKLVNEKSSRGQAIKAYGILKRMEIDFSDNGRFCNQMAWYILSNRDSVFDGPETAKKYAAKAVRLMEKDNDPFIDTAYNTMAEACYQLKEYDKMREYEKKALAAAPDDRKKFYRPRSIKPNEY